MTRDSFRIVGDSLSGYGVSFDVGWGAKDHATALVDIANVAYRQGRDSARFSYDDRFDLSCAVDALRALGVIVGPIGPGDRYRRCADIIARLLQEQQDPLQ
jgi:hypothetical protein